MIPVALKGLDVRLLISPTTGIQIPVIAARGLVFSAWAPSQEELKQLNEGVPVWIIQRGIAVPEMTVMVADRRDVILPEISREAQSHRLDESVALLQKDEKKLDRLAWWMTYTVITGTVLLVTTVIGACIYAAFRLYSPGE